MAVLGTLKDLFTSSALNTQLWTQFTGGSATMSYSGPGAAVVFPGTTSSSTDGDLSSATTYSLISSQALMSVTSVSGASAANTDCVLRLKADASNYVQIFYEAGTIFFSKVVATVQTNITSTAYSAATHAWWQIRESSGTTYWETSKDGLTWTTQTSQANPITLTALTVVIGGISFGVDTNATSFRFRFFNTPSTRSAVGNSFEGHITVGEMSRSEIAN